MKKYAVLLETIEGVDVSKVSNALAKVKKMPTHYQNLVQLIGILVERATKAFLDASIKFILDGNPLTNLRTPGLKSYETRVKWALQLAFIKRNE